MDCPRSVWVFFTVLLGESAEPPRENPLFKHRSKTVLVRNAIKWPDSLNVLGAY